MALTIANLSIDKELDRAEMGAVRGGSIFQNNGVNANSDQRLLVRQPADQRRPGDPSRRIAAHEGGPDDHLELD